MADRYFCMNCNRPVDKAHECPCPILHPTAEELLDDCGESVNLAEKATGLHDVPLGPCPTRELLYQSILEEAQSLVHGDRNATYGFPWEDYARTVGAFKALMGDKKIADMTPEDGMMFMVCVKLSRQINLPKRDNLVDAAGYLECINWSIDTKLRKHEDGNGDTSE